MKLYDEIQPYSEFFLNVSDKHSLYVELSGNPDGIPLVFLHGGPGAGVSPLYRRYFDPKIYKIILFDQRGSGKSTPYASCDNNTSQDLIEDIKSLLDHLDISRTIIYGGSWGSTLALLYAQKHPDTVSSLVLRGIFLCRKNDIKWFYQSGADSIFPEYWREFIDGIPDSEKSNLLDAFYKRIHGGDDNVSEKFCKQWSIWEGKCSSLFLSNNVVNQFDQCSTALAKIESHYFYNDCFIEENQIIKNINKLHKIKCHIIHGRYDIVCPINQAYDLHNHYSNSQLHVINDAGHSLLETGISEKVFEIFQDSHLLYD